MSKQVHLRVTRSFASLKILAARLMAGNVVPEVGRLAADMEADAFHGQPALSAARIISTASPREAPNLMTVRPWRLVLSTFSRKARPACGACFLILRISS